MSSARRPFFWIVIFLTCCPGTFARSETETSADPVREMLMAHFESVQGGYRRMVHQIVLPSDLGLTPKDLDTALDTMQSALSHWKIEFHASFAAFAVQTTMHLLVVNPQSMPAILEEDDDVLLHESVHLADSQIQRQLYGLHSEFIFLEWLQDHLDEEKASKAESELNRLGPDDILRLKLWSSALRTDPVPLRAAGESFRASWICEIQAYYVQMLAFDHELKEQGATSLKRTADMLRQTLTSETGLPRTSPAAAEPAGLVDENDMALTLFQSFSPNRVSEKFQEAVLPCVMMDQHKALLFKTLAEASGWNLAKARMDAAYRRRLLSWARQTILRWNAVRSESTALNVAEMKELRENGLIPEDLKP